MKENTTDLTIDTLTVTNKVKFDLNTSFEVSLLTAPFSTPVTIEVGDQFADDSADPPSLKIVSVANTGVSGVDPVLVETDINVNPPFNSNTIEFAVWRINPRNISSGVQYEIKASKDKTVPISDNSKVRVLSNCVVLRLLVKHIESPTSTTTPPWLDLVSDRWIPIGETPSYGQESGV